MARSVSLGVARLTLLWALLAIVFTGSATAADLVYRPTGGGLQISLTTNGYKFRVDPVYPLPIPNAKERRIAAWSPSVLVANVVLSNRGVDAVPFTFADAAAAERKFRFRVFAADGTQVWESEADAPTPSVAVEAELVRRSAWRRTIQVPLRVEGAWLASGRYTLEASVDAEGGPGATAVFEVVNLGGTVVVPPNTGIMGRVIETPVVITADTTQAADLSVVKPIPGAYVTVREIVNPAALTFRPAFVWSGYADANGNFRAPTIAGRFRVTASRITIQTTDVSADGASAGLVREGAGTLTLTNSATYTVEQGFDRPIVGWPINLSTSVEVEVPLGQFVSTTLSLPPLFTIRQPKAYSVEEVTAEQLQTLVAPSPVRITAKGTVTSGGWSNAQLVPRVRLWDPMYYNLTLPESWTGVLEFDMIATPPTGAAPAVMTPIVATKDVVVPLGVREIRVYSQTNSQSAILLQPVR